MIVLRVDGLGCNHAPLNVDYVSRVALLKPNTNVALPRNKLFCIMWGNFGTVIVFVVRTNGLIHGNVFQTCDFRDGGRYLCTSSETKYSYADIGNHHTI